MRSLGLLALAALLLPAALAQVPPIGLPETPLYYYHTYATLGEDLNHLAAAHPDLAQVSVLGQSRLGLNLWSIEVGNRSAPDYASKPGFYLDGGHHGDEHLGIEGAYLFAEQLLTLYATDPATKALVDGHRIYITPLMNPDGKNLNTRTNGAQVNLNRNYPFHWNERGTGPLGDGNYAGPSEGSEPETQANMAFLREHDLSVYVSLHTGSYDIVRPFGYAPDKPVPDEELYQGFFAWALDETGLASRYPGGSGESICWAYGAQGLFSVLFEVYEEGLPPSGSPEGLLGPVPRAEVMAQLDPHLRSFRHLLENTARWGARLEAELAEVQGDRATLAVRNAGLGEARNLTSAATGITFEGVLPASLAPGAEARVPVRLEAPSQVVLGYERLRVVPSDGANLTQESVTVQLESRNAPPANPSTPDAGALGLVALAGAALLAGFRASRR
jgi:hypothetical protein